MKHVDFDFHGLAGIRLIDASAADVAAVKRQLGLADSPLNRDPDVSIRFVDRLPGSSPICYVGLDEAGFTDDSFFVLRGKHKSRTKVQIPFDQLGNACEILCERGVLEVPLLIPILNLTILARGALPLHASALTYEGTGVLAMGWSKGGKTEVLLACMASGATYVGDEWVYLDGDAMYGVPQPIRVWNWHLRDLPRYRKCLKRSERLRLQCTGLLAKATGAVSSRRRRFSLGTMGNRVRNLVAKQLYVDVAPQTLFGEAACALEGVPDKILFVASHESPEVIVRPVDPLEVAKRMVFSLQEEQRVLTSYYWRFRFAFPDASNELLENSMQMQSDLLSRMLKGKEAVELLHPYPVDLTTLRQAVQRICAES